VFSPLLFAARQLIIKRMCAARLPAIYQWPETAEEGGLLAYGPRLLLCYRHVVRLVDKVLRGAKPAELPIEQPFKFELVVNLNTASALGSTIPSARLLMFGIGSRSARTAIRRARGSASCSNCNRLGSSWGGKDGHTGGRQMSCLFLLLTTNPMLRRCFASNSDAISETAASQWILPNRQTTRLN
jgi:hypothetical protein